MIKKAIFFMMLVSVIHPISASAVGPEQVALEFMQRYYETKSIHRVKSHLHPTLLATLNSEQKFHKEMWASSEELVGRWEDAKITHLTTTERGEETIVKFRIEGVRFNKRDAMDQSVYLRLHEGSWKIWALA
ncbi:hypothetical protein [Marinobacter sp. ANT_B65]|uniref:hypothetical protein n=1 Tax=Marinobacter sp. ANT_B65 TaxID=2039467 RepID=UPI000BBEC7EC|nr:hypothetical protein [Marinobacter sp. ANT_B65]PCM43751.1 hypothetical protein CPA50_15455 [Marinobacter sp. ANT_B65]